MLRPLLKNFYFYFWSIIALLVILGFFNWQYINAKLNSVPISKMQINTNLRFTSNSIITQAINNSHNQNKGYFDFSTKELTLALQQNPWIKFVMVSKVFPDTVNIRISEQKPYAIWTNGQEVGYITENGNLFFSPAQMAQNEKFTQIVQQAKEKANINDNNQNSSTQAKEKAKSLLNEVGEQINLNVDNFPQHDMPIFISNQYYIQLAINYWNEIKDELTSSNLSIKEIRVDSSDAWQIMLNNGILLNLDAIDVRQSIRRFLVAAQQIKVPDGYLINYVDLRYNNGIAVKFIKQDEAANGNNFLSSLVPGKGGAPLLNATFKSEHIQGNYQDDLN
ncbi:cell division protein FtsQ/DivIB [Psittacicella hinzii]|uniref:POTRA domain-containing protein n=1 Tax=Psittacicella hinzii TaxID=2028575 RepID=A0A3A1YN60_9GAMM|nr:cell division protein FtsQ/DivIB [Psittacicella hinzii]RIY38669.1 hypothetical protein CKF58_03690 [Psittacicella hinzii]